jgi:vitamin B12 transporter
MTHITKLSIASAITALAGTACLHADDQPARTQANDDAIYQLADTVVVAHTYEVPLSEVGSTVEVITREDFELSQTTFLHDNLRELPGVNIRSNGGAGATLGITTRGLTKPPVIMIDGIEVSNPASGQMLNPSLLFSNSVETLEFLKGPQSSLYGANAFAGVINISTQQPEDGETNTQVEAGIGTYNSREASLSFQSKQGAFEFSADLNRHTSDGFSTEDNNREADGYENTSARVKIGYQATENLEFYTTAYYIDSEIDIDSYSIAAVYDRTYGNSTSEQLFTKSGAIFQATDSWETQLSYAYTHTESISDSAGYITGLPEIYESEGKRHTVEWRNVVELNDRWTVATGAEYEEEKALSFEADSDNTSYYLDNMLEVFDNLFWSIGGRHDNNSDFGNNNTWRTTISYLIEPLNTRLHGSYGTSFQAPSLSQRFGKWGKPGLLPEEGTGWDFGIETSILDDKLVFDVTLFGNDIDDKINFAGDTNTGTYLNKPYKSSGVETSISWEISESLQLFGNYTYTDGDNGDGSKVVRVPQHHATLGGVWTTMEDKLKLRASINYIGKQNNTDFNAAWPYPNVELDDYTVVNLSGQYAVSEAVTLWSSIKNLLDKEYQEILGYNSPSFNITAGIRINF